MRRPSALRSGSGCPQTRTAADVPELHEPWSAAIAAGLLRISDGTVTSGPALDGWPPGDAALLDAWFAALRGVCQVLRSPAEGQRHRMLVFALALLKALENEDVPEGYQLWQAVQEEAGERTATRSSPWKARPTRVTSGSVMPSSPASRSGTSTTSGQAGSAITLQKVFPLDPGPVYPVCVAYQGASPVEYPSAEDPGGTRPIQPHRRQPQARQARHRPAQRVMLVPGSA